VGVQPESVRDPLTSVLGHSGTAHALVMLVHTLERARPGELIVVVGFGQGCEVLMFEVTEAILRLPPRPAVSGWLQRRKAEHNYVKYLFFNGLLDLERGMRAEADFKQSHSALYRNRKTVLGLVGGRCSRTGTVQFPKSDISVEHLASTLEDYPLADRRGRVLTYTSDNLTYTPDPPSCYGTIEFEGGGRMTAELVDVEPETIEVGHEVRMMFRVKSVDTLRGFVRYFWKAAPVARR